VARDVTELKRQAAFRAMEFVRPGMVIGLGAGTTAIWAVRRLGELRREGKLLDVLGVPCSRMVREEAERLGVPLTNLEEHPTIDLTIDGADEVAPNLDVIKGLGGALLHEKIVAQATRREIIVVDGSKLSTGLGIRAAVPVEVYAFGWRPEVEFVESLGARARLRRGDDGEPLLTDEGNLILDCDFGEISEPRELARKLEARAGIAQHGLFLGLVSDVVSASEEGVTHLTKGGGEPDR
jgi:ribose 5-phosphate isomerase A